MTPLKPSEVRLGNLTSHGVVVLIENERFVTRQEDLHYSASNCVNILPVPLTPEILEGFGFVKDEGLPCLQINKNGIYYIAADPEYAVGLYSHYGDAILLPEMKHAHTLQNFVQAISGVELVYKPNNTK